MNKEELKTLIIDNNFINKLRIEMKYDDREYNLLCRLLGEFKDVTKDDDNIDKELMLTLYSIPQVVHNIYLQFSENKDFDEDFISKLEDSWIELDELVIDLLS